MRITILGASGKIGRRLTDELLARGHDITAVVHTNTVKNNHPKLNVLQGDVYVPSDIKKAIEGSDVVVCALGSWGAKSKYIVSTATINLIPAMKSAKITRFVSVTGGAARSPDEKEPLIQKMTRILLSLIAKPILVDAEEHLRLLSDSNLDWTAVRSPVMTNSNYKNYNLSKEPVAPWATISRNAVVTSLADLVENKTYLKQAPFITKS